MKTLIEAVEAWVDERVFANSWTTDHEPKFNEMAVKLERADRMSHSATVDVQDLNAKLNEMEKIHIRDANRIAELERRVMSLDEDNSFDKSEANIIDIEERLEDIESRLQSVEGEVDIDEIAQNVHNNVESFIIDAVRTEIDAIDFKVTVDR
jgi:tetrahydromethanopterin S-methyltransferase subunit G